MEKTENETENEAHEVELRGDTAPRETETVNPITLAKDLEDLGYNVLACGFSDCVDVKPPPRDFRFGMGTLTLQVFARRQIKVQDT